MKIKYIFLIFTFAASIFLAGNNNSSAQSIIVASGNITTNTTWSADTVKVTGDITINDNITLTITPGTYVKFQGYFRMKVFGTILAEGTEDQLIVFTIADTTGISNQDNTAGGWHGILFDNGSTGANGTMFDNDTSKLSFCRFEFCKTSTSVGNGVVLEIMRFSRIIVENCVITNNFAKIGATIFCSASSGVFRHNLLFHNRIHTVFDLSGNSSAVIERNFIANNTGCGISISESSPFIIGNIIVNNSYTLGLGSGGISMGRSNPLIINNTICNNYSLHSSGGIMFSASTPRLYNNIIWGNTSGYGSGQIYLETANSSPDIYNCLIQGGLGGITGWPFTGKYINNLNTDPDFIQSSPGSGNNYDGSNADWNLELTSACINAGSFEGVEKYLSGKDYNGIKRIKYGQVDIGALEFCNDHIDITSDIINDTTWFADTVKVWENFYVDNGVTLKILPGTIVQFQGKYKMEVGGTLLADGLPEERIKFTVADTTYFSNPDSSSGGWGGLRFGSINPLNDSSSLSWCNFEYGKTGSVKDWDAHLSADLYGGALLVYDFPRLKIISCQFSHNKAKFGGAIFLENSDILISKCIFMDNYAQTYGGGIYVGASDAEISGNFISNNRAGLYGGGINISGVIETPLIRNNIISNNYGNYGGAIACFTPATIINNTIVNNQANNYSGGILVYNSKPYIINSIMWGNKVIDALNQINARNNGSPMIYNCDIQGGIDNLSQGIGEGVYIANIDEIPGFINPSGGAGTGNRSKPEDWSLTDFSVCINKGTSEFAGIPDMDYFNNPRINETKIDIGAIENQSRKPEFLEHPVSKVVCGGDGVSFMVQINDTANIRWQKDGIDIPGATMPVFTIDSVAVEQTGVYKCIISNSYGEVESLPAFLLVNEKPVFLSEPGEIWAEQYKPLTLKVFTRGTSLSYRWQKDGANIAGVQAPELTIINADYSDEGEYSCIISNSCGGDTTTPAPLYIAPQICMVTVSTISGKNLVVWEKKSKAPLLSYNIYRESKAAGIYDLMGNVASDKLSIFIDPSADPVVQAYIYKITGIDTSGTETDIDLCRPHKTIHLLVSTNPELNTTQLSWDKYYGFDYQTYNIYRSETGDNFSLVHAMASSLSSWTDPSPSAVIEYYRIAVEKPAPCIPTGGLLKVDSGPYSHSMSNIEDNRFQSGENPPDTIILSNSNISENNNYGMLIGRLAATDPDTLDSYSFMLADGEGDDNNSSFTILGDMLLAAEIFDYEVKNTYSIRVRCIDRGNKTREQIFIILIDDVVDGTGTETLKAELIRIYPNPFNESTIFQFNNTDQSNYTLFVTDLTGKVVYHEDNILTSRIEFNRQGLPAGCYFIELRGPNIFRGKMVIE